MIIIVVLYILIVTGKRGPLLWGIVNIYICYYILTKIRYRFYIAFLIIGASLYFSKDAMFNSISSFAPRTVERIQNSLENGDTDGRLDFNNAEQSTYLIGLKNFSESPLFGSYFRLKTNYQTFKGHYPHNIFVEILMTLGVIGFLLFLYLLFKSYRNCLSIFRGKKMLSIFGFVIIFLSSFLMLQTSRTLLFRIDFWLLLYILCSLNRIIIVNRDNKVLIKQSQKIIN
jgi:O-antigen ligase